MNPTANATLSRFIDTRTRTEVAETFGVDVRTVRRWLSGETRMPTWAGRLVEALEAPTLPTEPKFSFIDLFAGVGGTRLGFESADGRCVFTSEWDKFAQRTYAENFKDDPKEHTHVGDITAVNAKDIPDHDVLVGGFPCQPFSIAGVSKKNALGRAHGFADATQGTLFFDVARIIDEKRPRAFLLENVRNLQSHDRGRTFQVIMSTLREQLGYEVHAKVVNAAPWVPQGRQRIYIIGFREPSTFDWDDLQVPAHDPTMRDVLHPEDGSELPQPPYTDADGKVAAKYTLTDHLWKYLQDYKAKHSAAGNGFGYGLVGPNDRARTLSARYHKDGSEILVEQPGRNPRRLTPRECARLMGFPESYRIPVSDTQAYRQFGNSVVVPVIEAIASMVADQLA